MRNALLIAGAILLLALTVFHGLFWRLFDWKRQLAKLHPVNQGAVQAMNIVLMLIFAFFAVLSFFFQTELLNTRLGNFILVFITMMFFIRAYLQVRLFSMKPIASKVFSSYVLSERVFMALPYSLHSNKI